MGLGAAFAMVFAKLALAYPGAEGAPIAIRKAFGARAGRLASIYLLCAVCAGPVAVLMTAASTISRALHLQPNVDTVIAGGLLLLCACLLTRRIALVGKHRLCRQHRREPHARGGQRNDHSQHARASNPPARRSTFPPWAAPCWFCSGRSSAGKSSATTPWTCGHRAGPYPWGTALAATMICGGLHPGGLGAGRHFPRQRHVPRVGRGHHPARAFCGYSWSCSSPRHCAPAHT